VTLGELHLDHEQDLVVTCDMWVRALAPAPRAPATWDDGVDVALLCHLLFLVLQVRENHRLENVPGFPISEFFTISVGVSGPESVPPATSSELSANTQISGRGAPRSPLSCRLNDNVK
jgi:hypothetical protein